MPLLGIVPTEVLVLDDAAVIVGATDGTLSAFDLSGAALAGSCAARSRACRAGQGAV